LRTALAVRRLSQRSSRTAEPVSRHNYRLLCPDGTTLIAKTAPCDQADLLRAEIENYHILSYARRVQMLVCDAHHEYNVSNVAPAYVCSGIHQGLLVLVIEDVGEHNLRSVLLLSSRAWTSLMSCIMERMVRVVLFTSVVGLAVRHMCRSPAYPSFIASA
jgi:hypothetical protein